MKKKLIVVGAAAALSAAAAVPAFALENEIHGSYKMKYFLTNATAGFEIAYKMAGLRPGDEVIVPAITFIATICYPLAIGAGHVFCILLKDAYPINILTQVKNCPEVCRIFCATANPLEVIVASTNQGWGVLGIIDGFPPKGVETDEERSKRRDFLRTIGYKC